MRKALFCAVLLSFSLAGATAAFADPPPGKGNAKGHATAASKVHAGQAERRGGTSRPGRDVVVKFPSSDVTVVREYYAARNFCPPGLAKKNNGCLPPGQAKKWQMGQPLPRDVIFHALPPDLLGRLAPAPVGTRYVRVDNDILSISTLTGMVLDAIANMGRG